MPIELASSNLPSPEGKCSCDGQLIRGGVRWDIATCRSNCQRGLGFRCGRSGWLICSDGYICQDFKKSTCPSEETSLPATNRQMSAEYTFYNNNTLKLTFKNSRPIEEAGNSTFEIEAEDIIELPDGITIGGIHYTGYKTIIGNYTIDANDGQYGSVIINIALVQ